MTPALSDTQINVLKAAAKREDGNIEPLPEQIKGGARTRVIQGLLIRALIAQRGHGDNVAYHLNDAGYAAIGRARPASDTAEAPAAAKPSRTRDNSKQALMIGMLKRPEGATLAQLIDATGWQPHTVRGAISGALKKKLGLAVESSKLDGAERIYRIGN